MKTPLLAGDLEACRPGETPAAGASNGINGTNGKTHHESNNGGFAVPVGVDLSHLPLDEDDGMLLQTLEDKVQAGARNVQSKVDNLLPKVEFPRSEIDMLTILKEIEERWVAIMKEHLPPVIAICTSVALLLTAYMATVGALASPYLIVALNFTAFAYSFRSQMLNARYKFLATVDDMKRKVDGVAAAIPAALDESIQQLTEAVQAALQDQTPLYAKVATLSRWFATDTFEVAVEYSVDWRSAMRDSMAPEAAKINVSMSRVMTSMSIFDKDGRDVTGKLLPAEMTGTPSEEAVPEQFPLMVRYRKPVLPAPEDLLSPLDDVTSNAKKEVHSACNDLVNMFTKLLPTWLMDEKKFQLQFVAAPLVIFLALNLVSVLSAQNVGGDAQAALSEAEMVATQCWASAQQLWISFIQLVFSIVVGLQWTYNLVEDALRKKIEFTMSEFVDDKMAATKEALNTELDAAVKVFWSVLKKMLGVLKVVFALKAAMLRLRAITESVPSKATKTVGDMRTAGTEVVTAAVKNMQQLGRGFEGVAAACMKELCGIGSKSLAAALKQGDALKRIGDEAKADLEGVAEQLLAQGQVDSQAIIDRLALVAQNALSGAVEQAKSQTSMFPGRLQAGLDDALSKFAALGEKAQDYVDEIRGAVEDVEAAGGQDAVIALAEQLGDQANQITLDIGATEDECLGVLAKLEERANDHADELKQALADAGSKMKLHLNVEVRKLMVCVDISITQVDGACHAVTMAVAQALEQSAANVITEMRHAAQQAVDNIKAEIAKVKGQAKQGLVDFKEGLKKVIKACKDDMLKMSKEVGDEVATVSSVLKSSIREINVGPLEAAVQTADQAEKVAQAMVDAAVQTLEKELGARTEQALQAVTAKVDDLQGGLFDRLDVVNGKISKLQAVEAAAKVLKDATDKLKAATQAPLEALKQKTQQLTDAAAKGLSGDTRAAVDSLVGALDVSAPVETARTKLSDETEKLTSKVKMLSMKCTRIVGVSKAIKAGEKAAKEMHAASETAASNAADKASGTVTKFAEQKGGILSKSEAAVERAKVAIADIGKNCSASAEEHTQKLGEEAKKVADDMVKQLEETVTAKANEIPDMIKQTMIGCAADFKQLRTQTQEKLPQFRQDLANAADEAKQALIDLANNAQDSAASLQSQAASAGAGNVDSILVLANEADDKANALHGSVSEFDGKVQDALGQVSQKTHDLVAGVESCATSFVDKVVQKFAAEKQAINKMAVDAAQKVDDAFAAAELVVAESAKAAGAGVLNQLRSDLEQQAEDVKESLLAVGDEIKAKGDAMKTILRTIVKEGKLQLQNLKKRAKAKKAEIQEMVDQALAVQSEPPPPGMDAPTPIAKDDPQITDTLGAFDIIAAKIDQLVQTVEEKFQEALCSIEGMLDVGAAVDALVASLDGALTTALQAVATLSGIRGVADSTASLLADAKGNLAGSVDMLSEVGASVPVGAGPSIEEPRAKLTNCCSDLQSLLGSAEEVMGPVNEGKQKVVAAIDDLHDAAAGARAAAEGVKKAQKLAAAARSLPGLFGGGWGW